MSLINILPFRFYSLALLKELQKTLFLEWMVDKVAEFKAENIANGDPTGALTDAQKALIKPVIIYSTPKKAFSQITTPLLNGALTTFGCSFYLADYELMPIYNGTKYNYIPYKYPDPDNSEVLITGKLSHPIAMKLTYNVSLQTVTEGQMEELELRWFLNFIEGKNLVINGINYRVIPDLKFNNNTERETSTKDKTYIRKDTTLTFPIAHFPQEILEEPKNYGLLKEIYIKIVNENMEENLSIL